jgi:hypothetical protein
MRGGSGMVVWMGTSELERVGVGRHKQTGTNGLDPAWVQAGEDTNKGGRRYGQTKAGACMN